MNVTLKFPKLGKLETLKTVAFTDSSYRNSENKEKSVGGRYIALANKEGKCSLLVWKSKTIQQVCKSVKTAETISLERGIEDSIYLAKIIQEIYSCKEQISVEVKNRQQNFVWQPEQYEANLWENHQTLDSLDQATKRWKRELVDVLSLLVREI